MFRPLALQRPICPNTALLVVHHTGVEPQLQNWPTVEEQAILRASMVKLILVSDEVAAEFYRHIFASYPSVRPLFAEDTQAQEEKFMLMLALMLDELEKPDDLKATLKSLGKKHYSYGAMADHYPLVRISLVHALTPVFEPEVLELWGRLYDLMAYAMVSD